MAINKEFASLDIDTFAALIRSLILSDSKAKPEHDSQKEEDAEDSTFAKRMITGLAAEQYFAQAQPSLPEFKDFDLETVTHLGCGYDFRLSPRNGASFVAVEVKGLAGPAGSVLLTEREHSTASRLADRYFLFVVRNFKETPSHACFRNPLSSELTFVSRRRVVVHNSWTATIA